MRGITSELVTRNIDRFIKTSSGIIAVLMAEINSCNLYVYIIERFGVGQNLYIYKQSIRLPPKDWERAVTDWYDEVALFSNKKVMTDMWDSTN